MNERERDRALAICESLGIDPVQVVEGSLSVEVESGRAQVRWEGFIPISEERAYELIWGEG